MKLWTTRYTDIEGQPEGPTIPAETREEAELIAAKHPAQPLVVVAERVAAYRTSDAGGPVFRTTS
jgi:hypothetical protein